jgi:carbamoyltransferase
MRARARRPRGLKILGISAYYHDAAAALVVDGEIVAAAQEERFTRKRHDHRFPQHAIDWCLAEAGIDAGGLDYVGFYDKPLLKFDRLIETYVDYAPGGIRSFLLALPLWLRQKLHLPREMRRGLGGKYRRRFVFAEHHESHAASAFFPSPFDEAAVLTLDGVGEWATASFGVGRGNRLELTGELRFPHSLGLLYSAFTYWCGFKVNSGEYKLMGLAPYGRPVFRDLILEKLVELRDDGSFRLAMDHFAYCNGLTMTSPRFDALFGMPPRRPEEPLTERHMDVAASIQAVTEEIVLRIARHVHARTGQRDLCMAGGVALNCVANGRVLREGPFERIWVQPAAGDAGGALGVALFIWHQLLDRPRTARPSDAQKGSLLGPAYGDAEVESALTAARAVWRRIDDEEALLAHVAERIAAGDVVGWMQGRMEFGPRALGARSILADARDARMQSLVNTKIKFRESFRPFAPVVLAERAAEWFEMKPGEESPYMLLVAPLRESRRVPLSGEQAALRGLDALAVRRSEVPAVTHVDWSARVQTVTEERNGRFARLLRAFEARTGCPVMVNTSFNVRGEPIVCTPQDAYRCFMATDMDLLVIGSHVLRKAEQPADPSFDRARHLARFSPD